MNDILLASTKEQQLIEAVTLFNRFRQHDDKTRSDKTLNLIKKIYENKFIIAFSGHFSAGKSTMINTLIGEQVLPTSPIPTSANLVKIGRSIHNFAKVTLQNNETLLFSDNYDYSLIKEYCKQEDVKEIEIGNSNMLLDEDILIMDTPGIDSTDEAHRLSTESALHVADLVFYVMDYNHVQSELNFMFTKNLFQHGVKLYLIINQIDKHNESELSFDDFRHSVQEAFSTWGVNPSGIFFTSLKDLAHPENEITVVENLIDDIIRHRNDWTESSIQAAFRQLIHEHSQYLEDLLENEKSIYEKELVHLSEEDLLQLENNKSKLTAKKHNILAKINNRLDEFVSEREKILKNAYLMPYDTRELAELFLQSQQTNFKTGLFLKKKKTLEEKMKRLQTFTVNINQQIETQINWHIRQWLSTLFTEVNPHNHELLKLVQSFTMQIDSKLIVNTVKKGAGVTGQSVLNYCEDLSEQIKKETRIHLTAFQEKFSAHLEKELEQELHGINNELEKIELIEVCVEKIQSIKEMFKKKQESLTIPTGEEKDLLRSLISQWETEKQNITLITEPPVKNSNHVANKNKTTLIQKEETHQPEQIMNKIETAISYLENDLQFKRIAEELRNKIGKIKKRQYTVALFGAFSAGKSSFANALIGEKVLPVSPNPTTATINRICPVSKQHPHRSAIIHFKTEEEMLKDINFALSVFGEQSLTLEEAYEKIPKLRANDQHERQKVHLAFLLAFFKGYPAMKESISTSLSTDIEGFTDYVGIESLSCFVESINLYYDCSFTRQGITLVDTPGANSINARHTEVAFDYIKNVDAIFYVTYYNHAFSRADREFLIQLGRVKNAFELDKMFFVVNAIDLASTQNDVKDVLQYVKGELSKHGIHEAKLFGVSSMLALIEEQKKESNLTLFQNDFYHFIKHDLSMIAIQGLVDEYDRALTFLNQLIKSASVDQEMKNIQKQKLSTSLVKIEEWLTNQKPDLLLKRLNQEVKELIFYVKQRVFYRFSDFFKEAFNPTILQSNQRKMLPTCLDDLINLLSHDLNQELRATSLRVEQFVKKSILQHHSLMEQEIQSMKEGISFAHIEIPTVPVPEFTQPFISIEKRELEMPFKYFKSAKSFFEQNEKKKMEEAFFELFSIETDKFLEKTRTVINEYYGKILKTEFSRLKTQIVTDTKEQFEAWHLALSDDNRIEAWKHLQNELSRL